MQSSRRKFLKTTSKAALATGIISASSRAEHKNILYKTLGKTGLRVSAIGFGATRTMEPAVVHEVLKSGINFIDTGRHYYDGQNEEMLGNVLKGHRKQVILQSKLQIKIPASRKGEKIKTRIQKQMRSSMEASLKALQTDVIDVMLLHNQKQPGIIDNDTVREELQRAKEKGWIRFHGFSSHKNQSSLVQWVNDHGFYDVVLIAYNHAGAYTHSVGGNHRSWDQGSLEKALIAAHQNGVGIVAMKTTSGGKVAFKNEPPSMKAALKWLVQRPFIHTTATAMLNFNEIHENVQALR